MTVKKNMLLNNDGLYNEYRNNYEDTIDFFTEKKIEVTDKPSTDEDKKDYIAGLEAFDPTYVQGLENLVKQFSQHNVDPKLFELYQGLENHQLESIQGSELYINTDLSGTNVRDLFHDCMSLIQNNTKKLQKRVLDVDKRRYAGTVRTKPIKMKTIVKKLGTSKNVASDPLWIPAAVGESIKFTTKLLDGYSTLTKFANLNPTDTDAHKGLNARMFNELGKVIIGGSSKGDFYTSNPLPGNMVFNLELSNSFFKYGVRAFYTDVKTPVTVPAETCLPTAHLMDKCIDALESYLYLFTKSKNQLIGLMNVISTAQKKADRMHIEPRENWMHYLARILDVVKRLLKAMFKLVNHVTDAVYDFILQGIK